MSMDHNCERPPPAGVAEGGGGTMLTLLPTEGPARSAFLYAEVDTAQAPRDGVVRRSLLVCVNELPVRPYFTDMFTIIIANSHASVATRLARIFTFQLPSQQHRLASDSGRGGSQSDGQTSYIRALWPRR